MFDTKIYEGFLYFMKGHKQLVLEGITSFFNHLDETCRKEDKEDRWAFYNNSLLKAGGETFCSACLQIT